MNARQKMTVAGIDVAAMVFEIYDPDIEVKVVAKDGTTPLPGVTFTFGAYSAVSGADARGDALAGIDADREGGLHALGVVRRHLRQLQPVEDVLPPGEDVDSLGVGVDAVQVREVRREQDAAAAFHETRQQIRRGGAERRLRHRRAGTAGPGAGGRGRRGRVRLLMILRP